MEKKTVEWIYRCYLGKHLGARTGSIHDFVTRHDGRDFFLEYSTDTDSILDFIKKVDDQDLW